MYFPSYILQYNTSYFFVCFTASCKLIPFLCSYFLYNLATRIYVASLFFHLLSQHTTTHHTFFPSTSTQRKAQGTPTPFFRLSPSGRAPPPLSWQPPSGESGQPPRSRCCWPSPSSHEPYPPLPASSSLPGTRRRKPDELF